MSPRLSSTLPESAGCGSRRCATVSLADGVVEAGDAPARRRCARAATAERAAERQQDRGSRALVGTMSISARRVARSVSRRRSRFRTSPSRKIDPATTIARRRSARRRRAPRAATATTSTGSAGAIARASSASAAGSAERGVRRARDDRARRRRAAARASMPRDVLVAHGGEHERRPSAPTSRRGRTPAPRRRPDCARRRAAARGRPAKRRTSSRPGHDTSRRGRATIASARHRDAARVERLEQRARRRPRWRSDARRAAPADVAVVARAASAGGRCRAPVERSASTPSRARMSVGAALARDRARSPSSASGATSPDDDRHAGLDDAGLLDGDRRAACVPRYCS